MNWIDMFGGDMNAFGPGVTLRMSNCMPSSTTCPQARALEPTPIDATTTKPGKYENDPSWQTANKLEAALKSEGCQNTVPHTCSEHHVNFAWWWKSRGCNLCARSYNARVELLCSLRPEARGTSLIRSLTPKKEKKHRRNRDMTPEQEERRRLRRAYTAAKYPYTSSRKGSDTNLDTFTGPMLSLRPTLQSLGRHFVAPSGDAWR